METALLQFLSNAHWSLLLAIVAAGLFALGKGADWLVDEAVALSQKSHIPEVVIAATIISLGTTTPEAAVSVLAAIRGSPGLALGNAVGSIICDTGLILGLACIIAPLRLNRRIVNRQGWVQFGAGVALILASFPWDSPRSLLAEGGRMPQEAGFIFLAALAVYLWLSIVWARNERGTAISEELAAHTADIEKSTWIILAKLICAVAIVLLSAHVLIPSVTEAAQRIHVPESIIAATLVAFGTSLPELVTAVTAARRGHGEIAIGNVIGADILNVLFVSGASAAVTSKGLQAGGHFFYLLFPIMFIILAIFRIGIASSRNYLRRPFGYFLLGTYLIYLIASYLLPTSSAI
jgi:cation:H+ antiporter